MSNKTQQVLHIVHVRRFITFFRGTKCLVCLWLKRLRHTYLGPLAIELTSSHCISQRRRVLPQFEKRRRPVAVQDAVLRVGLQGVGVQVDGRLEVAALTCLVALLHFLHELRLAETAPASSIPRHAADRSARCPRAEDRKLEKRIAGVRELQSVQLKNVKVQLK